jgi:photosystem II stability/assembly factor-like uncharacterized protein
LIRLLKIFVLSLICITSYPQEYWETIQTPVTVNLNSIFALDSSNIWIAADSGIILFTSDKGETWDVQSIGKDSRIFDVHFINENVGWAVGWETETPPFGTYIIKTTNSGTNWEYSLYREHNVFLHTIYFVDSLNGFSGGSNTQIIFTSDGGASWLPADIVDTVGAYFPVYKFKFLNPQYGYAVGGANEVFSVIWRTLDSGKTWLPFAIGIDPLYDITILDSLNIYAIVGDIDGLYQIGIIRSADAGETWSYKEVEKYGHVTGFSFRTPSDVWAALWYHENILVSKDSGNTWDYYPLPDNFSAAFDIEFTDSLTGFIIGESGKILKYHPDKPGDINDNNFLNPENFYLYQNFPNPFNAQTNLKYFLKNDAFVRLVLYNSLGEEVLNMYEGWKHNGNHSLSIDLNKMPAGVYFYQLIANNNSERFFKTKKMILLK